ncbi:hypothetical protein VCV18_000498 [Metarhizium anisopliae]
MIEANDDSRKDLKWRDKVRKERSESRWREIEVGEHSLRGPREDDSRQNGVVPFEVDEAREASPS